MEGTQTLRVWRAPRPCGASPTQPYKCGRNVKVKVKTSAVFDFNILTALKGWVGQAAKRTGALHIIILKLNDYILPRKIKYLFYTFRPANNYIVYVKV